MSTYIKLGLKNNSEAVQGFLNRKQVFHLVVYNTNSQFIPQVRVELEGPPEVRILSKVRGYGGIEGRTQKIKPFVILPTIEGVFNLSATLSSNHTNLLSLPIKVIVGNNHSASIYGIHTEQKIKVKPVIKLKCSFCGELVEADSKECLLCGASVEEPKNNHDNTKTCHICGKELTIDAKFCVKCGTKTD
ncbi:MAG: zinc ribbon domain-containing protein [Promethearchaeota archaeon]